MPARWRRLCWSDVGWSDGASLMVSLVAGVPAESLMMPMPQPDSKLATHGQSPWSTRRWRLWIDRGGSYDILQGQRFSIGGPGRGSQGVAPADLMVRCRWGRRVATLLRLPHGDAIARGTSADQAVQAAVHPLEPEQRWSPEGQGEPADAAALRYRRPSPLSGSAVITVEPPHRFYRPIDAVILLDQTILLGPETFNHVCLPSLSAQGWVLLARDDSWWIQGAALALQPLELEKPWRYDDWSLMMKAA